MHDCGTLVLEMQV